MIADLKAAAPTARVHCYSLFATEWGLAQVDNCAQYDELGSVFVLGESYRCFDAGSMYFPASDGPIDKDFAETLCRDKGKILVPSDPLGYRDGQLLLAFSHNTPDNSLPVLWYDEPTPPWTPIFPRHPKVW